MELQPVQSSNVAAAGYLDADRVLLVRFTDGSLYARINIDAATATAFDAAPSKGAFLAVLPNPAVKIAAGNSTTEVTPPTEPTQSTQEGGNAATSLLQTYQDDDCCGRRILKFLQTTGALNAATWDCPKCGTEWKNRMHGSVRHWFPNVATLVMKPRDMQSLL